MNLVGLFKKSLKYPADNYKVWIIVAILCFLSSLLDIVSKFTTNMILSSIIALMSFIITLMIAGFCLKVLKSQINGSEIKVATKDKLIGNLKDDFICGLKVLVVEMVYFLIFAVVVAIISYITGAEGSVISFISQLLITADIRLIPTSLFDEFFTSAILIVVISLIFAIILYVFTTIATAKLAETGKILDAFDIKSILSRISSIGWGGYISYLLLLLCVGVVIGLIFIVMGSIPYVGNIAADTIVKSFMLIFTNVSIAKIYTYNNE